MILDRQKLRENFENFDILACFMIFLVSSSSFVVFQRSRVHAQCTGSRAGYVFREGEGSTGPSRGEHRLTVYRAHASFSLAHLISIPRAPVLILSIRKALRLTCMRAVNRQPMFTARGTRRAFSFSVHVSCSITRVLHWNTDS